MKGQTMFMGSENSDDFGILLKSEKGMGALWNRKSLFQEFDFDIVYYNL